MDVNQAYLAYCQENGINPEGQFSEEDGVPLFQAGWHARELELAAASQVAAEVVQEAARCVFVMRHIASMGDDEFDGDTVDLRFEDDQGRDTGCDVSISEYAGKAADVITALLATSQGEA